MWVMGSESRTGFEFVGFEFQALNSSLGRKREELQHSLHMLSPLFVFPVGWRAGFQHILDLQNCFCLGMGGLGWEGGVVPNSLSYLPGFQTQNSDSSSGALPSLAQRTARIPAAWLRGLCASV